MTQQEAERIAEGLLPCARTSSNIPLGGCTRFNDPSHTAHGPQCPASRRRGVVATLLSTAAAEYARGVEPLRRAITLIEGLAEQQAMPDNSYVTELNELRALLDHPQAERSVWQPIETIPEEGTFLVYLPNEKTKIQTAVWHKNVKVIGGHFYFDLTKPTHWCELPAPPSAAEDEQR